MGLAQPPCSVRDFLTECCSKEFCGSFTRMMPRAGQIAHRDLDKLSVRFGMSHYLRFSSFLCCLSQLAIFRSALPTTSAPATSRQSIAHEDSVASRARRPSVTAG
mmetsp:Transcript_7156/g.18623  ORF Transcript_7156/g.18623 Transcript_7156/m.18623 type:complete len:105 (+) Transcript_7156:275-589(+)